MTVYDVAARLPSIAVLRERCKALAMLDAIVGGDYYAYDREWGEDEAASMRNGSGEEYDVVFTADGVFIRGVDHESSMSTYTDGRLWPGLLDGLPEQFQAQAHEPAFCRQDGTLDATFVLWRRTADERWHAGDDIDFSPADDDEADPDGSWLLDIVCDDIVAEYVEHATDVYEVDLDRAAVEHFVAFRPLTDAAVHALNLEAELADLRAKAAEYGYPTA
ncbi:MULTISPECIES: hypothetical protein [unclassified Micromonospora]|uniref:hypothetical protein n=1 Tax=unclassified Micromonospora TaxID=2617518 RepID=UPI000EF55507|nr:MULTISPECIES: hypothetical protein [unclassified Micromonospora]RLP87674.1 hypothetical protein EAD89_18425 [Micromonospora sp. BL4]RLP93196.1 hypothetical protein EAD98_19600 [Micromonospora sp. CV4]